MIVTVRAEGPLARLAHDIRLEAGGATAESDGETVRARFPVAGLRAVESSRHGKERFEPPTPRDAEEIESRVRTVALAGGEAVLVTATRDRVEVTAPRGRQTVAPREVRVAREGARLRVRAVCTLSLSALGTGKVDMPLGAVRLSDAVEIDVDLTLADAP